MAFEIDDGGPAFPFIEPSTPPCSVAVGATLRDYFAIRAPAPSEEQIRHMQTMDRNRNPHNDSYKPPLRSVYQIRADLAYEYADCMLKARK